MPRAYIGLGANLKDPAAQVREALALMASGAGITLVAQSSLYRSAPLGPAEQPDYCNAACVVDTTLSPGRLLTRLHEVERAMGRERPPLRWAPRVIDLDLLHYGGVKLKTSRLQLPHPELHKRNFVVAPLAEIAPELEIAGLPPLRVLARQLGGEGLSAW